MSDKDTLIYIGDPMCSWCYGFSPELDKIKAAFPDMDFFMIMGGLRANGEESMADLKEFLWEHWKEVQKASGQKFNFGILNSNEFFYNTEPACRAVTLVRSLYPHLEYDYFKALQRQFYVYNEDPTVLETFVKVLQQFEVDTKEFERVFKKQNVRELVMKDFEKAHSLGVTGFPALIAVIDGKFYKLTAGYSKAERIIDIINDRRMK